MANAVASFGRISMTMKAGSAASCSVVIPSFSRIFAERDQRLDLAGRDASRNLLQASRPASTRQAEDSLRAVRVRIAIFAQQNVVARSACAARCRCSVDAEKFRETRGEPEFFVRHAAGGEDRDFPAREMFQLRAASSIAVFQSSRSSLSLDRICGSSRRCSDFEIIEIEPAVVAHPAGIDGVVFARRLAVDHIFARADDGVATGRATGAEAFGFLQKPDAHLETEIATRSARRPDRYRRC